MTNVVPLSNCSIPSNEPVQRVVETLEAALTQAREGKIIGVAVVLIERDPAAFVTEYHAEQSSCHHLSAGVLSLAWQIGKEISESE